MPRHFPRGDDLAPAGQAGIPNPADAVWARAGRRLHAQKALPAWLLEHPA
jgi:hypothetical protein